MQSIIKRAITLITVTLVAFLATFLIQTNSAEAAPQTHKVKAGESYSVIAKKYNIKNWKTIRNANNKKGTIIYVGERLKLREKATTKSTTVKKSNTTTTARSNGGVSRGYWDGTSSVFGQCVYGVEQAVGLPNGTGNAKDMQYTLPAYGYRAGAPKINSVVVFPPGVLGAHGIYGHLAYVTRINGNGTVQIREMNYYANGGGFNTYSYRTIPVNSGVIFMSL